MINVNKSVYAIELARICNDQVGIIAMKKPLQISIYVCWSIASHQQHFFTSKMKKFGSDAPLVAPFLTSTIKFSRAHSKQIF